MEAQEIVINHRPKCPQCHRSWDPEFMKTVYMQKRKWQGYRIPSKTAWVKTGDVYCEDCKCYFRQNEQGKFERV
jgi:hypothetical protein